jgi:hypothetical protein
MKTEEEGFHVLTASSRKLTVSWDVAPNSLLETDGRFRETSALMMAAESTTET